MSPASLATALPDGPHRFHFDGAETTPESAKVAIRPVSDRPMSNRLDTVLPTPFA